MSFSIMLRASIILIWLLFAPVESSGEISTLSLFCFALRLLLLPRSVEKKSF